MSVRGDRLVSLVIPVSSPSTDIAALVDGYGGAMQRAGQAHEFVFVLDGVAGAVEQQLRDSAHNHPIKVVRLQGGGFGESIALSAGVERAAGEFIINVPPYLQAEPDDLIKIVHALENGAEFVATWRHPRVDPWLNQLQSKLFNKTMGLLMGVSFHDLNSSVRGMHRRVLEQVNVYGEQYRFLPVLAMRQGFRTVEVKVRHREEMGRHGFYGLGVYLRRSLDILAVTFLTRFTQRPLRFFGMLGLLLMLVGAVFAGIALWNKFSTDISAERSAENPVLVLGAILIAFGVQLIGFGLVGEIIIFTQARNLRDFRVEDEVAGAEDFTPDSVVSAAPSDDQPLRVRELLPGEDARWDAFVRQHPDGSFFHLSGWRKVVHDVFRHSPIYLVAEQGRQWRGCLPLFLTKSPFLGRNLLSVPYGVYGGLLSGGGDEDEVLLRAARMHGREAGARYVELRHQEQSGLELPQSGLYVTFRKELPADPEQVLPAIPKKARAEVRRARDRFHLKVSESRDVDEFYGLFARNKRRLGSPSLPRRWFAALLEEFGSMVVIHAARDPEGRALAAVMSFSFNGTLCAYYSGTGPNVNRTGVNDFIYAMIMQWAVERGFHTFDFGRSRRDTGPAKFKKNMGFVPEPLAYEYVLLDESATIPEFHPSNPRLKLPQQLWSRLPPFVASSLGARLSRYLP